MYCKYCGKEIEADSSFCKHCGANLNTDKVSARSGRRNGNIVKWFLALSKQWQIILMSYSLWLSGWICWLIFCLTSDSDRYPKEENIVLSIICVFILPAAILFLWHYYVHLRTPNVHNHISHDRESDITTLKEDGIARRIGGCNNEPHIVKEHPLLEFAKDHGKMKRIREYDAKTCSYLVFYVFANNGENIITVQSSEETKDLSSEQISTQKYILCVNEYSDGRFQLAYKQKKESPEVEFMPKAEDSHQSDDVSV